MVLSIKKGVISLIALIVLMILLLLGTYFLTFTLTESKISQSQGFASQTYYLAEAGIGQAIWKLKNEEPYKSNFITQPTCQNWSTSFTGGESLISNGSYTVSIQNTECARAKIISTATLQLPGNKAVKRVIKTIAFKAISGPTQDSALFAGGTSENMEIYSSRIRVNNGNIYCNNNFIIKSWSEVTVLDNLETEELEGQALAVKKIDVSSNSTLNSTTKCDKSECLGECLSCPPSPLGMPMANFDSYKNDAQTAENNGQCQVLCNGIQCSPKCIFTTSEFENLLCQVGKNGELTLNNNITYIKGPFELKGGRRLVVNGVLVADGTIDIGTKECWKCGAQKDCGFNKITVCDFTDPSQPTSCQQAGKKGGLLSKGKINFDEYSSFQDIKIGGLIYAEEQLTMTDFPYNFTVKGGILARKVYIISMGGLIDVYLDNSIISQGLGETNPLYSPVITVEHWEEVY